jgi:hypothetical protein
MSTNVLAALAGEWHGDEHIATTRWGPGGPASARISARLELGSRILVQDYREERDGKTALEVHAVFVAGPEHDQYGLYWFDSYGFAPAQPAGWSTAWFRAQFITRADPPHLRIERQRHVCVDVGEFV